MIVQTTEEYAREIMYNLDENVVDGQIRYLKEKGYIKKSAKEEFEEYVRMESDWSMNGGLIDLARAAIEEEYQRGFASGLIKVKE